VSERRSAADLGAPAEAALSSFPFAERDWEQSARALEARLGESVHGSTDSALLAEPLPSEPGEPATFSATQTPLTSSGVRTQSLAEMARRSVEQKQASERELLRASFALAAQRPSMEESAAEREAVSAVRASVPPSAEKAAPHSVPAAAPQSAAKAPPNQIQRGALGLGVLALAAAALLWLRKPAPAPAAWGVATPTAANAVAAAPITQAVNPANTGTSVNDGAQALPAAVDPNSLSPESVAAKPAEVAHATQASGAAPARAAPSASASGPSPEKIVLEDEQPSAPAPAAPAEKPADKALPPDPALRPADSTTAGSIPVKPSTGAVQAALGAVMSGARHCVAGDDAPSSAVVVFGSDGHVQSVNVSGPAAGKPSGACIQSQLSRARVQPFAQSTFSINATVRPD
jgi:hypothetical protein